MPKKDDLELTKKKLVELETDIKKLSITFFAYQSAFAQILDDAGLLNDKKFKEYLNKYKKQFAKLMGDAEFLKMMRQFKRKGK